MKERLKAAIREIPDFPKPGVLFRDISPILSDPDLFQMAIELMASDLYLLNADTFVGIESRGFIFAAALAERLSRGFIPIRKAGNLPPPVIRCKYSLEYGEDEIEIAPGKGTVVIIDDVYATGGTMKAATDLCIAAGYSIAGTKTLITLDKTFLNGVIVYE